MLVELTAVRVTRAGKTVLGELSWALGEREHWVITGPNGAGKTTFLRVLAGEQRIDHDGGRRVYRLTSDDDDLATAREQIGFLSPELHERLLRMELPFTVRELISGGLSGTLYLASELSRPQRERVEALADELALTTILEEPISELSFGQFRRALLARILVRKRRVLALDELGHGIDRQSRKVIFAALEHAAREGTSLVVATHRFDEIPAPITYEARVEAGKIVRQGPLLRHSRARSAASLGYATNGSFDAAEEGATVLRLRNVDIFQDGRRVLSGINWEIRAGEHWLVTGPNGAGKTTLAKLLYGRLRAAYGGTVERFESAENFSVSEIRRTVAMISDEEQVRYNWSIPVESVIASGFFHSVGLLQQPTPEQMKTVRDLIADFGIEHLRRRPFLELSFGERRLVLVARALVRVPRLLILDEALNGFDRDVRARILRRVETLAGEGTSVVIIGHHDTDVPEWIANELRLENGRIAFSGQRSP